MVRWMLVALLLLAVLFAGASAQGNWTHPTGSPSVAWTIDSNNGTPQLALRVACFYAWIDIFRLVLSMLSIADGGCHLEMTTLFIVLLIALPFSLLLSLVSFYVLDQRFAKFIALSIAHIMSYCFPSLILIFLIFCK